MPIQTQNPATGEIIKTFQAETDDQVDAKIAKSFEAFQGWRKTSFEDRAEVLRRAADILEVQVDALAAIATLEMGKTFKAAQGEVRKCAKVCRYYADHGAAHLEDHFVETEASQSYRKYVPLGPLLAVMPWNFPFWQVFRFAAPALMAGNTGLLKHASNVPQVALAIEDIWKEAGALDGVFQTLLIGGSKVERVLRNPHVRGASLTGSEPAGAAVASVCGEEIKPTILELGGSDPFIIMPSADIDAAIGAGTTARTLNNGQSCIAAKRFIIHADIYDTVKARLKAKFDGLKIGDPMLADTDVGPLVNAQSLEDISEQVETALKDGAICVTGAKSIDGPGFFFRPGILENIQKGTRAYTEEIFGPVALLFKVNDLNEAISLANDSPFGLGSAIFTKDKDEQHTAIHDIEAGATFVNAMTSSDVRLPFGGTKRSGYGRELAAEGIRALTNIKTVLIA